MEHRTIYNVVVRYTAPYEVTVAIAANSEEHCREIVVEAFKGRTDFAVVDIYSQDELQHETATVN